jgi:hypothetical protein
MPDTTISSSNAVYDEQTTSISSSNAVCAKPKAVCAKPNAVCAKPNAVCAEPDTAVSSSIAVYATPAHSGTVVPRAPYPPPAPAPNPHSTPASIQEAARHQFDLERRRAKERDNMRRKQRHEEEEAKAQAEAQERRAHEELLYLERLERWNLSQQEQTEDTDHLSDDVESHDNVPPRPLSPSTQQILVNLNEAEAAVNESRAEGEMVLSSISASNNADAMMTDETAHGKRSIEAARGTDRVSLRLYETRAKEKGRAKKTRSKKK